MENSLFYSQVSPLNAGRLLGLCNFKIFWESMPQKPFEKVGSVGCWYSRLLYSNLLPTSIFIETPGVESLEWIISKATTIMLYNSFTKKLFYSQARSILPCKIALMNLLFESWIPWYFWFQIHLSQSAFLLS